jgi:hypothetical protein
MLLLVTGKLVCEFVENLLKIFVIFFLSCQNLDEIAAKSLAPAPEAMVNLETWLPNNYQGSILRNSIAAEIVSDITLPLIFGQISFPKNNRYTFF